VTNASPTLIGSPKSNHHGDLDEYLPAPPRATPRFCVPAYITATCVRAALVHKGAREPEAHHPWPSTRYATFSLPAHPGRNALQRDSGRICRLRGYVRRRVVLLPPGLHYLHDCPRNRTKQISKVAYDGDDAPSAPRFPSNLLTTTRIPVPVGGDGWAESNRQAELEVQAALSSRNQAPLMSDRTL